MTQRLPLLLLYICVCVGLQARVTWLPATVTDHMVLQRRAPLPFSGTAEPGERIRVSLADISCEVRADAQGRWQVLLPALEAGGPYTMQVGDRLLNEVYVGEVFLCSGQSNMEFRLNQDIDFRRNAKAHSDPNGPAPTSNEGLRRSAADARLHLYNMQPYWYTTPARWSPSACDSVDNNIYYRPAQWEPCTDQNAPQFSAVAYYFGRMLADSLGIHIGLINNAIGGSTAESWIEEDLLRLREPQLFRNWSQNEEVQDWVRLRSGQNVGASPEGDVTTGHRHPYQPSYLFATGIEPIRSMPLAGAIWYQGESNAQDYKGHERIFRTLIESWRMTFDCPYGPLPFYMVQLSSLNRPTWPEFRNSQRLLAEELEGVEMAVSSDVGDSLDVHPRLKRPVGERLARLALGHRPLKLLKAQQRGAVVTLAFDRPLTTSDGHSVRTLELQNAQGEWKSATAIIRGSSLELRLPTAKGNSTTSQRKTETFKSVRYGWQPYTRANLVSHDGWPMSTFEFNIKPAKTK